jgi:hypothetical protein
LTTGIIGQAPANPVCIDGGSHHFSPIQQACSLPALDAVHLLIISILSYPVVAFA